MRAVWIKPDRAYLEERRRRGQAKRDEVWDGVLHMVSPPVSAHCSLSTQLTIALDPIAKRRRFNVWGDSVGVFDHDENYRVPDVTLARPDQVSKRGLEGAELVIEILSPDDESRDKLPFYASVGVREIWLIEPEMRAIEIYTLRGSAYLPVAPTSSPFLGIAIDVVDGPRLRLRDGDEVFEV
jgi:Uma2 family endonuclease